LTLPEFLALIVQHLFFLLSLIVPHNFVDNLIKSTIGLFVVIDPIGSVPLFIALTRMMEKHERKAVSKIAIITAAALLIVFAVAGTQILAIFGITIFSFMVAGGVLLFMVSIELMTHGVWRFGGEEREVVGKGVSNPALGESGVVPLAFPLLAGKLSIVIVISATYIVLLLVNPIYRLLRRRGSMIITRVFAVFIAAIAVQYIVQGAKHLFI